jgi:hypothetical protein
MLSKRFFLIALLMFGFASVASAQQPNVELLNTHTFSDGAMVMYPASWQVAPNGEDGIEQFVGQESVVEFYPAAAYDDYSLEQGDVRGYLGTFFEAWLLENDVVLDVDVNAIEDVLFEERSAAFYEYHIDDETALMIAVEFTNGKVGIVHALTLTEGERDIVLAMAETYNALFRELSRRDVALAREHTLEDGVIIEYPSHFYVDVSGNSYDLFESDDSTFVVYVPRPYSVYALEAGDIGGFLQAMFMETMSAEGLTFDVDRMEVGTMDGRLTALYDYTDAYGDEALMIVIQLADGRVGVINAWAVKGMLIERNMAISMAVSYNIR